MRLLRTSNCGLCTFVKDVPPYAILSHTWGETEVTFQDMLEGKRESHPGWSKIKRCCSRAAVDGHEYVWIDTCCIDKSDISELSEAINSMFRWYEQAETCYAFLEDVPRKYQGLAPGPSDVRVPWIWHFRKSRFFTRGWTLQELLAPRYLVFLDQSWDAIGSREAWADEVCAATGITSEQQSNFMEACVATKLSWAATRKTARVEDRAYSLLGLLGVNMPLIYGEGERSFIRLQEELIRRSADETIFAWTRSHRDIGAAQGFLAPSPEFFILPKPVSPAYTDKARVGFTLTNLGLQIRANLLSVESSEWVGRCYAIRLNCVLGEHGPRSARKEDALMLILQAAGFQSDVFICIGIGHPGQIEPWELDSLGTRDIVIVNQRGIDIESPMTHEVLNITFDSWYHIHSDWLGYYDLVTQYKIEYPKTYSRGGPARTVEYHPVLSRPGELRNYEICLGPGAAFIQRFQLADLWTGTATDGTFGIILKSAARQPLIGIWEWDGLEEMKKRLEWPRRRRYPLFAKTMNGSVFRISLRYLAQSSPQSRRKAVLDITVETDETKLYAVELSPEAQKLLNDLKRIDQHTGQEPTKDQNSTSEHTRVEDSVVFEAAYDYDEVIAGFIGS
ncbi:putative HET-domain-containing [Seiridium cardinale]|uniref:HET-domain-containing n=1 Tax=Seiridium cardinale TaxID=138064 RepID=A0ABR2Y2J2_9PEZI